MGLRRARLRRARELRYKWSYIWDKSPYITDVTSIRGKNTHVYHVIILKRMANNNRLPLILNDFFKSINKVHQYQTRLACKISYYLPKARTNYGKFNIRFFGAKVWNSIEESLRSTSRTCFKILLKESHISNYCLAH